MSPADGGCRSSAAAEERIFRNCILAGLRPAGSHCKNNLFSFRAHPAPPIGRFLRGADLPPFVTERWRQKCPQGTSVGIGRRFSLSGHKRLRCFARPLRALEPPSDLIPPPVQCGICGALRATMIYYDSNSSILKFSKPPRAEASARAAPWRRSVAAVDNTPPRQSRIKFALFSA